MTCFGEPLAYFEAMMWEEIDECILWPYGVSARGRYGTTYERTLNMVIDPGEYKRLKIRVAELESELKKVKTRLAEMQLQMDIQVMHET